LIGWAKADLLYLMAEKFTTIDIHPSKVTNADMSTIFEELIRTGLFLRFYLSIVLKFKKGNLCPRQEEREAAASPEGTLQLDCRAMVFSNPLRENKTKTRAREVAAKRTGGSVKALEHTYLVFRGDADPRVADCDFRGLFG
jgi:hypothetical protein